MLPGFRRAADQSIDIYLDYLICPSLSSEEVHHIKDESSWYSRKPPE